MHLGQKFHSQKEFEEAKSKYENELLVPYTVKNCTKRELYNSKHIGKSQVPEGFLWKEAVIACKHYGDPRQHTHVEGTKKRCNQSTFKLGCKAKFNLNYDFKENCYVVTKLEQNHLNHNVKQSRGKFYPEFRRPDENTVKEANKLLDFNVQAHRIRGMVTSTTGKAVLAQDIQNIRNKWKAALKGEAGNSPEEALFDQLINLKEEDPHSIIGLLHEEETGLLNGIFFQTSEMRAALELYPEVLIMDTTYKLADNDMPLVVFEVIDCFGSGRIAGYSLVLSEKKEIVTAALELLKIGAPDLAEKVQVVMIDKDQSEIAAIKEVLPNAQVHLCDYHVKEAFKRCPAKKTVDWEKVEPLVLNLIYAFSQEEYDKAYKALEDFVGSESEFFKYFLKYWHNRKDLVWSEFQRNTGFTLGERTTGRLESHNAKIKIMIEQRLPVAEVILNLRIMNKNASVENEHKLFIAETKKTYHKYSKDPVIQEIMKINTPFVADLLQRQYQRSLEPPSKDVHITTCEECDCAFYTKFQLICAHIFRERRLNGEEIYDHRLIPKRWTVIVDAPKPGSNGSCPANFEVITAPIKIKKQKKVMTIEERYNAADRVCKRICGLIANCGGNQFEGRINALLTMEELFRLSKEVVVVGLNDDGLPDKNQPNQVTQSVLEKILPPTSHVECKQSDQKPTIAADQTTDEITKEICVLNSGVNVLQATALNSELYKQFKLRPKTKNRGRPKGKTKQKKRFRPKSQDNVSSDDSEEIDDVQVHNKCPSCNGPVICRTSFSKQNYQRKYIVCKEHKTDFCKMFHEWVDNTSDQSESDKEAKDLIQEPNVDVPNTSDHDKENIDVNLHALPDSDQQTPGFELIAIQFLETHDVPEEKHADSSILTSDGQFIAKDNSIGLPSIADGSNQDLSHMLDKDEDILMNVKDYDDSFAVDKNADVAPLNDNSNPLIENSLPAWYKCRTCGNKDIKKAKIINPLDKNFGREYYGCFLRPPIGQCTRPKPFLFWAANENSAKKRKQTKTEQNNNSKQKTIYSYLYGNVSSSTEPQPQQSFSSTFKQGEINCDCNKPAKWYRPLFGKKPPVYRCADNVCQFRKSAESKIQKLGKNSEERCCCCCNKFEEQESTLCYKCCKPVHTIPPCSIPSENGFYQERICRGCHGSSIPSTVTVRRKNKSENLTQLSNGGQTSPEPTAVGKTPTGTNIKTKVFYQILNYKLTKEDMSCLSPGVWLTDLVIDSFLALVTSSDILAEREASILTLESLGLECASMGSTFLLDRAEKHFFFYNDLWLVPSHSDRNHWILFIVLVKRKIILILNSMSKFSISENILEQLQILRYIIERSHFQSFQKLPDWAQWRIFAPNDVANQANGYDCGLFVCMWAYGLCSKTKPPADISALSSYIRQWMSELLCSKSQHIVEEIPLHQGDRESKENDDAILSVYTEFDQNVKDGTLVIKKPWKELARPTISYDLVDNTATYEFLSQVTSNLWVATDEICGAPKCKQVLQDMYRCEACWEYYHQKCINDHRGAPTAKEMYLCPLHSLKKSSIMASVGKRRIPPPLRLRKSLS